MDSYILFLQHGMAQRERSGGSFMMSENGSRGLNDVTGSSSAEKRRALSDAKLADCGKVTEVYTDDTNTNDINANNAINKTDAVDDTMKMSTHLDDPETINRIVKYIHENNELPDMLTGNGNTLDATLVMDALEQIEAEPERKAVSGFIYDRMTSATDELQRFGRLIGFHSPPKLSGRRFEDSR